MAGLPQKLGRGRPSKAAKARYQEELVQFCDFILKIDSSLDFKVSSRGIGSDCWQRVLRKLGGARADLLCHDLGITIQQED